MKIKDALSKFYVKLGGSPTDINADDTSGDILEKISDVYTDKEGTHVELVRGNIGKFTTNEALVNIKLNDQNNFIFPRGDGYFHIILEADLTVNDGVFTLTPKNFCKVELPNNTWLPIDDNDRDVINRALAIGRFIVRISEVDVDSNTRIYGGDIKMGINAKSNTYTPFSGTLVLRKKENNQFYFSPVSISFVLGTIPRSNFNTIPVYGLKVDMPSNS